MRAEIISPKTRQVLRDFLVSHSVLREIRDEFDAAHIDVDLNYDPNMSSERRTLVEQYDSTMDFTKQTDARKFLEVCQSIIHEKRHKLENPAPFSGTNERLEASLDKLVSFLERDGFVLENGRLRPTFELPGLDDTASHAENFDADYLAEHVVRIRNAVDREDPAQVIGQAKELVETCCKTILNERDVDFDENLDLHPLVRRTRSEFDVMPDRADGKPGEDTIRRLLSNLGEITRAMSELRNNWGTGHGKDGRWEGLTPRHARLAVGAATTLANFLFETHKNQRK